MKLEKTETLYLYWKSHISDCVYPGGVAFYDDTRGDYRLKIDFFPNLQYFLRYTLCDEKGTKFRLETIHKEGEGKPVRRLAVGAGFQEKGKSEIKIRLFPFERTLILALKSQESESNTNLNEA